MITDSNYSSLLPLDNEADERTYRVQRVIRHPSYNTRTLDYDVAILKLRGNTRALPHIRQGFLSQKGTKSVCFYYVVLILQTYLSTDIISPYRSLGMKLLCYHFIH